MYTFVGERRSATAIARGWYWEDGHLCAATLHAALRACGVDPVRDPFYLNIWDDQGFADETTRRMLTEYRDDDALVVGLGEKVQAELTRLGVPHLKMRHPAARGRGRARAEYIAHVAQVLGRVATAEPGADAA